MSNRDILKSLASNDLHRDLQFATSPRSVTHLAQHIQNAFPDFERPPGRRGRCPPCPPPDEDLHRAHRLAESRLRPGALPQGAQGVQAHPHQRVRCCRSGCHLQPPQAPQVPRGGRPRLQPEGVREHGRRGRRPGGCRCRCPRRRCRGLAR